MCSSDLYIAATNQVVSAVLVVERDAPTDKSRSKRSGNILPGHPSKKRASVSGGSEDPPPDDLAHATEEASLGATTPEDESPGLAESTQGSPARRVQHPVYFVSSVLRDARERYPMMQKLLLAVLIASRKMRHYFEGHPVTVVPQIGRAHV